MITCPMCNGKGEIEGMFPTDDGEIVDVVVCPTCHGNKEIEEHEP